MPEKVLAPFPIWHFDGPDGNPAAGWLVFFYEAGTTTKATTYTDHTGLTPNTNPIVLDAYGNCRVWFSPATPISVVPLPPGPPGPQGIQGPPGPPGPLGNATDYAVTIDIPSQTIYNGLSGQYVPLVPAQGVNIGAYPTQMTFQYLYQTVPYVTGGGNFVVNWGPPIIPVAIPNYTLPGTILAGVENKVLMFPGLDGLNGQTINVLDFVNKPITLSFDTAITKAKLITIGINAAGAGYVVNDTGTIVGGNGNATYIVTAIGGGGAVTGITLTFGGTAYSSAVAAATATGGGQPGVGIGLTLDTVSTETIAGMLRVTTYFRKAVLAS